MAVVDARLPCTGAHLENYFNVGSLRLTEADFVMPPAIKERLQNMLDRRCNLELNVGWVSEA
jgi:hypothetical protein